MTDLSTRVLVDEITIGRFHEALERRPEMLRLWRENVKALNRDSGLRLSMTEAMLAATMLLENDIMQAELLDMHDAGGDARNIERIHKMISKNREMLLMLFKSSKVSVPEGSGAGEAVEFLSGIKDEVPQLAEGEKDESDA